MILEGLYYVLGIRMLDLLKLYSFVDGCAGHYGQDCSCKYFIQEHVQIFVYYVITLVLIYFKYAFIYIIEFKYKCLE